MTDTLFNTSSYTVQPKTISYWDGDPDAIAPPIFSRQKCSNNSTDAVELVQDFPLPQLNSEDLSLLDCARKTPGVNQCLVSDIQGSESTMTSGNCQRRSHTLESSIYSQHRHPVSPFQLKVSDSEPQTREIVLPQLSPPSESCNPGFSVLKTCLDYLTALLNPDSPEALTLKFSEVQFTKSGMSLNGSWSAQDTLQPPLLGSGYSWLESPGALSSMGKSRPPGQTKLEAQLKKRGLIGKNEVLDPVFLLRSYSLPESYLDPSESRAAIQLLDGSGKQLEIFSIPESPPLLSEEFNISTVSCPSCGQSLLNLEDRCGICGWNSDRSYVREKSRQIGALFQYTANRPDKNGVMKTYPLVEGERNRAEDNHWYWGFSWAEMRRGKWVSQSCYVPRKNLSLVRALLAAEFHYSKTAELCGIKSDWIEFCGSWIMSELKPKASPRLLIVSLDEGDFCLEKSWCECPANRRTEVLTQVRRAIADGQKLKQIADILVRFTS